MMNVVLLSEAIKEAELGLSEGGLPIGSVIVDEAGQIISRGHNLRVQTGDPTAHAEIVAIKSKPTKSCSDFYMLIIETPADVQTGTD